MSMNAPRRQRGFVLLMGMMLLLVLSMIAVTGMQGTTLQERMAGNVRETNLAFQRAEDIVRQVEEEVRIAAETGVAATVNIETWRDVGLEIFDCSAKKLANDPQFGSGLWGTPPDGGGGEYRAIAMSGVAGRAVACRPLEAEPEVGASQRSSYYMVLGHATGPSGRGEATVVTSYFIEN